ncbi:glutathione S-transferase Mu 1-like [Dugong dugon]
MPPGWLLCLIDGAHKITQSNSILCYIALKHSMCEWVWGQTEMEKIPIDILENQVMDTCMDLVMLCYNPDFEKLKSQYLEGLPDKMRLFSQFLGKQLWFAGDKITFVDFLAYDVLNLNSIFEPKCLDMFPHLKDFMARFEDLNRISAYIKSSHFLSRPIYTKQAM